MALTNQQPQPAAQPASIAAPFRAWLDDFAAAVRAVDYDAARAMFDPDVVSFGTFARMVVGIDELVTGQWKNIWPCTREFRFLMDEANVQLTGDLAWIASPWISQGRDEAGNRYDRTGRCTLVLVQRGGHWICVHSHFSREPAPKHSGSATPA